MTTPCAECRKPYALGSGICRDCGIKALNPETRMKSEAGRMVQARWKESLKPYEGKI